MSYQDTSTGPFVGCPNVPGIDVPYRSSAVRKELDHWVKKIRRHHQRRKSTCSGIDRFCRAVPDIWHAMKDLASRCNSNAVVHEHCIKFSDKSDLVRFLDDNLEIRDGEKHVVIVNAAQPFTIRYDAANATIDYSYKYVDDSAESEDSGWSCIVS